MVPLVHRKMHRLRRTAQLKAAVEATVSSYEGLKAAFFFLPSCSSNDRGFPEMKRAMGRRGLGTGSTKLERARQRRYGRGRER